MPDVIKRVSVFTTPWFEVVAKTVKGLSGVSGEPCYFAIKPRDCVGILAITDANEVILVRQYRPVVEQYTLELPSGLVDPGEAPEEAAKRELLEETGYKADQIEFLGNLIPDTGRLDNKLWCYFAPGAKLSNSVTEEGIELVLCHRRALFDLIVNNEFIHALNLAVLSLAQAKHGQEFWNCNK